MRILPLLFVALISTQFAQAEEKHLFIIDKFDENAKGDSNENQIIVFANVQDCKVKNVDYRWLMDKNGTKWPKPMDERLKIGTRQRITPSKKGPEGHEANCKEEQKANCHAMAIASEDLNMVNHNLADTRMIVKAIKAGPTICVVGAFIELSDKKVVQVERIDVKAATVSRNLGFTESSASARVQSVQVFGYGKVETPKWTCNPGSRQDHCVSTVTVPNFLSASRQ